MKALRQLAAGMTLVVLSSGAAWAQAPSGQSTQPQPPPPPPSDSSDTRPATTTVFGDTGLWYVPTGEVLPKGRWSFSAYRTNWDRKEAFTDISNFRGTFARFAVPEMERALGSNNMYRAINAVIVLSQLGSDRASNLLLLHVDQQNQAAWQIRLRAAEGERLLLTGASLDARKTLDAARKLRDAILREDNGLVLRSQLAALDAADTTALTPPDRTTLRSLIGESIASVAQRAAAAAQVSGPMVTAMGSAVGTLRVRITTYAKNEQQSIGAQLGPALGKMLEWARANWDDVKKDPLIDNDMRTFVAAAEGLLQFFDTVLVEGKRPAPTSDMRGAWDAGDKPKFETGVKAWQGVLDKAPYKP